MQVSNNSPYVAPAQSPTSTPAPAQSAPAQTQTTPAPAAQPSDSIANIPNWTVDLRANSMTTFPSDTMNQNMTFPDMPRNRSSDNSLRINISPRDAERFSQPDDIGSNVRRAAGEFVDGLSPAQKVVGGIIAGAADFAVDGKVKIGGKIKF